MKHAPITPQCAPAHEARRAARLAGGALLAALTLIAGIGLLRAQGHMEVIASLPPLYSGLEADSNATLQRLMEDRTRDAETEQDNANRSIKRDLIAAGGAFQTARAGEWVLAKLNRFYETSQRIREHIDVYSPSREYAILLSDDGRYGAEWYATLRLLSSSRYQMSALTEIANDTPLALAGRLGRPDLPEQKADGAGAP